MLSELLKKTRDISLKQMAMHTGYSQVYLSDIERGMRIPKNGQTLKKLAKAYGIPFDVILDCIKDHIKLEGEDAN